METDWLEIWRTVSAFTRHTSETGKIARGRKHFRRDSPVRADPLLDFVLENLGSNHTFLDIGAGNGRWAIPAAKIVRKVTAIEPSVSMLEMFKENIKAAGLDNIRLVRDRWENVSVEPHDIVACTHAIYETSDFAAFVRKMEKHARQRCYLVLRLPPFDGIIGSLSREIYGHPFDSPNGVIAWNALYTMGIYVNSLVEDSMHHWTDTSLEDALFRAKRYLNLDTDEYNELVIEILKNRLAFTDGKYVWPDGMRSVLLWWHPSA